MDTAHTMDGPQLLRSWPADRPALAGDAPGSSRPRRLFTSAWVVPLAVSGLLALPLAVAVVTLNGIPWHANMDLAITELRVRDVTSSRPPLVGLPGRFEGFGVAGSHPGPLSFWVLAPFYRLYGGSSWALEAATATLGAVALGLVVWMAQRRAGRRGALAAGAALALLIHAYGLSLLTQAWNPYLPVLWWPVFLVATWSVLCDDLAMAPVAVAAGTFCAQTHVSYVGLVAGISGVAAAALAARAWITRTDRAAQRRVIRWGSTALGLLVVLWIPPLVEEVTESPGNLSILREHFTHPVEQQAGLGRAFGVWLNHLDVGALVTGDQRVEGASVLGAALLVAWALAALATLARRSRAPGLLRLHAVVGLALGLGLVTISRIVGPLFDYLVLWAWGTTVLAFVSIGWTVAALVTTPWRVPPVNAALAALTLVVVGVLVVDATRVRPPQPGQAHVLDRVLTAAVPRLRDGSVPGGGASGHYVARAVDPQSGLLNAFTVLLELERHGLDAGVDPILSVPARPFRVMPRNKATAAVTYVVGSAIEDWRSDPRNVELAYTEPTAADAAEYKRLRAEVIEELQAAGFDALVDDIDTNLLGAGTNPDLPATIVNKIIQLIEFGRPAAVFVTPLGDPG